MKEEVSLLSLPSKIYQLSWKKRAIWKKPPDQSRLSKSNPNLGCPGAPWPWKWAALHETCSLEVAFRRMMGLESLISSWKRGLVP